MPSHAERLVYCIIDLLLAEIRYNLRGSHHICRFLPLFAPWLVHHNVTTPGMLSARTDVSAYMIVSNGSCSTYTHIYISTQSSQEAPSLDTSYIRKAIYLSYTATCRQHYQRYYSALRQLAMPTNKERLGHGRSLLSLVEISCQHLRSRASFYKEAFGLRFVATTLIIHGDTNFITACLVSTLQVRS